MNGYNTPFGLTEFSNEASATIPIPQIPALQKPAAPSNLTITKKTEQSVSEVELTWQDNSDNEDGFRIFRQAEGEAVFSLIGTTGANLLIFNDQGLEQNKTYAYYVLAYNLAGDSAHLSTKSYTAPEEENEGDDGLDDDDNDDNGNDDDGDDDNDGGNDDDNDGGNDDGDDDDGDDGDDDDGDDNDGDDGDDDDGDDGDDDDGDDDNGGGNDDDNGGNGGDDDSGGGGGGCFIKSIRVW